MDHHNCFKNKDQRVIISQTPLAKILEIECHNSKLNKRYKVPTFKSILVALKESGRTDIEINVEIKVLDELIEKWKRYKGLDHSKLHLDEEVMAKLMVEFLRANDVKTNILLTSFSRDLLLKLKSLKNDDETFRYGLLFKGVYTPLLYPLVKIKGLKCFDTCWWPNWKNTYKWLVKNKIDVFMPNWPQLSHSLYNKRFKKVFQANEERPFKIYPWTLNTQEEWDEYRNYDFDGIVTDYPGKFLESN